MASHRELYEMLFAYLCPAGDGVYTVSTAANYKLQLQQKLYGDNPSQKIARWQHQIQELENCKVPLLIGVPSDCGGGIQRGANWGPLFVRQALYEKILTCAVLDLGDVRVIPQLLLDDYLNQQTIKKCRQALYADSETARAVSPLSITREVVKNIYHYFPQHRLFALGGDHSVSYPLIKEYLQAKKKQGIAVAVLHFDAHTDLLKQRLGIDISFGSWMYHILSDLQSPQHLIQLGIRATGHDRSHWENSQHIQQYWATEIKELGISVVAERILKYFSEQQIQEIYVTFDIDCLDAEFASATGTPEPAGLSPEDVIKLINTIASEVPITGADLVEVAPFVKTDLECTHQEPQTTLKNAAVIAMQLIAQLQASEYLV